MPLPGWQQPEQESKNCARQYQPQRSHHDSFGSYQMKLEGGKSIKTFRKQLTAHNNVPSHKEDPAEYQDAGHHVQSLLEFIPVFNKLERSKRNHWHDHAQEPLKQE